MPSVTSRVEGDIAVVEVNNPPVNALSFHVREGLQKACEDAEKNPLVKALVLTGRRTFLGGADIREFSDGSSFKYPTLVEVTDILENSTKPVVAAIDRFALGGGFEIAISCHYRIAKENTQFGFPEVDIGILPAATGTQRFPRLVGLKVSLDVIPSGRRFGALEAKTMGAVDKVVKGNLLQEAMTFARSVVSQSLDSRRTSKRNVKDTDKAVALRDAAVKRAQQKMRGMLAPLFCIKSVMASVEYPYEEGLTKEREYSTTLFSSSQSKALQYAFFAQRAAVKWDIPGFGSHKTAKPLPLRTGAVIGAGTMGTGIAMAMLNAGMPVTLIEQDKRFLDKGVAMLKSLYEGSVRVKKLTAEQAKKNMSLLRPSLHYEDLKDVDIVVEAVFERMDVKKDIFRKLDRHCKKTAILGSNTSALDIDQMAAVTSRPDKVVGVHFFVPAYHMRLLENVRGAKTSPETIATAQAFGLKLGKVPIVVGNCDGFTANRMRGPHVQEAVFLLEEGSLPGDVDRIFEDFGFPLGPLKISDLAGLDIGMYSRLERAKEQGIELTRDTRYVGGVKISPITQWLVEAGRLGRKTGKGFYAYEKAHAKVPFDDPWVERFLAEYSRKFGIPRRKVSAQEVQERLLYSAINEGFKIMEEGISTRPEEIDTIWLLGFAWPRYLGGPMFYANMVGIEKVYERICHYYDEHSTSPYWQPSALLTKIATNKIPFRDWSKVAVASLPSRL